MADMQQALRDVILLELDWHSAHAKRLDIWAGHALAPAMAKEMKAAAIASRQRVETLATVLALTEPNAEAKAS